MSAIIDESLQRSFDPLSLLRPVPGADGPAGPPPDSENAPRVNGRNAFIWIMATREKAILLEEVEAGVGEEEDGQDGKGEKKRVKADSVPPARLWEQLFNVSQEYLREHGKDIRIAFACLEAWIRRDGLAGLGAGLELVRGLAAAYWETLHPLPSGEAGERTDRRADCFIEYYAARDDAVLDFSPLFFALNRHVPVATDGKTVMRLHETIHEGMSRPDPGDISETIRAAAAATPPETAGEWLADCRRAREQCIALEKLAAAPELAGDGIPFPSPGKLRRRIEEMEAFLAALYPHIAGAGAGAPVSAMTEQEEEEAALAESPAAAAFPALNKLVSQIAANRRMDNLRVLRILGRRFQDTEPHSPVGYAISHWARMAELPLPKLLDEMGLMAADERRKLEIFTGVRAPDKG